MEPLRWVLLLVGLVLIAGIFCYSRGWYPKFTIFHKPDPADSEADSVGADDASDTTAEPVVKKPSKAPLEPDSRVVTVRIMPELGSAFPAEELVLALRSAGLRHGQFGIFHAHAEGAEERIRYSVASLVEPGSFDLSNLKDSEYRGISIFAILPAEEDGVQLFDDMVNTARVIAKAIEGKLTDEQGGTFSLQRERYMREDLIDYLRRQEFGADEDRHTSA